MSMSLSVMSMSNKMSNNTKSVVWSPQPGPQTAAITSPVPELFYGGARGGGKTDFLLGDFAQHAGEHGPRARGIIFRRTLPEFREIVKRSQELFTPLGATYLKAEREWQFPNGATLVLRYLYDASDAGHYQGHSYTWVGVDEAGNYPNSDAIDLMRATLRSPHGVPTYLRLTGNPGGVGHLWLKERYIDPAPPYTPHKYQPQPDEAPDMWVQAVFIPAQLEDNQILMQKDPEYEHRLAAAGGPALYRAWRFGDWNAVIGAAFSEWRNDVHIKVIDPLPDTWRLIGGMDWGYSAPGAFYVLAFGPDGEVHVPFEFAFNGKLTPATPPEEVGFKLGLSLQAYVLDGRLPSYPEFAGLDSSAWSKGDGRGGQWRTIAELIQNGINRALKKDRFPLIEAPRGAGSRVQGKQIFHQLLKFDRDKNGNVPSWLAPKLTFHPLCTYAIRTIPALPVDQRNPEDVDTDADDHAFDGVRYGLAVRMPEVYRHSRKAPGFDTHPGFDGQRRRMHYDDDEAPTSLIIGMGPPENFTLRKESLEW